ncbi:MAG: hypothetical protein R2771_00865 [Saprospiraceae bacterium]
MGINYCFLGKVTNQVIYVENINKYSDDEILRFSYCLSNKFDLNSINIESDIYFIPAFWPNKKRGLTLYRIQFELIDVSDSEKEVLLQNQVKTFEKNVGNNRFTRIEKYQKIFDCL